MKPLRLKPYFGGITAKIGVAFLLLPFNLVMASGKPLTDTCEIRRYSVDEGLRQSMVKQVFTDGRGVLWLATGDGLHRFDGKNFSVIRVPYEQPFGFTDNIIRSVFENSAAEFYLETSWAILKYNPNANTFKKVFYKPNFYPHVFTNTLFGKPLAWIPTMGYFAISDTTLIPLNWQILGNKPIPYDFIPLKTFTLNNQTGLIQGERGVIEISKVISNADTNLVAKWIPVENGCFDMAQDRDGRILILNGPFVSEYKPGGLIQPIYDTKMMGNNAMFCDSKNVIWFANSQNRETYKIEGDRLFKIEFIEKVNRNYERLNPFVINFFEDPQHNLWFCTDGDGVLHYQPQNIRFVKAEIGFVRCITLHKNKVYAGTFKNGLWELNPDLTGAKPIFCDLFDATTDILSLMPDSYNRLWVATRKNLYALNVQGQVVFKYPVSISNAKFFTYSPDTLVLVTNNNLLKLNSGLTPELIHSQIGYFFNTLVEFAGVQWMCSPSGLYKLNPTDGVPYNFFKNSQVINIPVKSGAVIQNQLWLATSKGLMILDSTGRQVEVPNFMNTFKDEIIYSLIPDQKDRIWISSNLGIACIDLAAQRLITFGLENNLQSLEFNGNAHAISENGTIYFGGIEGINGIGTSQIEFTRPTSVPKLVSLTVSDTLYTKGLPVIDSVILIHWHDPHFGGQVASTDYFNPDKQWFSFFLSHFDDQWSAPTPNQQFNYRHLPPGEYELWVKYADSYYNWSQPVRVIALNIKPPLWKRWWFITLSLLLLLVVTFLITKRIQGIRYRNQIKELEHQNALERERLRISRDLHDELGAGLSLILLNSSLAQNQVNEPDAVDSVLKRINRNTKDLYESMSNLVWLLKPENQTLGAMLARLREIISDICEDAGLEVEFDFTELEQQQIIHREAGRHIFLIIKEAVNNAVKYACANTIVLSVHVVDSNLAIAISDNGIGLTAQNNTKQGNGLVNMRTRTEHMNGRFGINSEQGQGTRISLVLPLDSVFELA